MGHHLRSLVSGTALLMVLFIGCSKDTSLEDAGDKFFKGITTRDTALLRTISSKKLLANVTRDGWPPELVSAKPPASKTLWEATGHTIQGDTVAFVRYTLTNTSGAQEATATCKLRLVKEGDQWKVEDLTPLQ